MCCGIAVVLAATAVIEFYSGRSDDLPVGSPAAAAQGRGAFPAADDDRARRAPSDVVELNVGGTLFSTTAATLRSVPGSRLARMAPGGDGGGDAGAAPAAVRDGQGRVFIDRDPALFASVLEWLRTGALDVVYGGSLHQRARLLREAQYYGISDLVDELECAASKVTRPVPSWAADLDSGTCIWAATMREWEKRVGATVDALARVALELMQGASVPAKPPNWTLRVLSASGPPPWPRGIDNRPVTGGSFGQELSAEHSALLEAAGMPPPIAMGSPTSDPPGYADQVAMQPWRAFSVSAASIDTTSKIVELAYSCNAFGHVALLNTMRSSPFITVLPTDYGAGEPVSRREDVQLFRWAPPSLDRINEATRTWWPGLEYIAKMLHGKEGNRFVRDAFARYGLSFELAAEVDVCKVRRDRSSTNAAYADTSAARITGLAVSGFSPPQPVIERVEFPGLRWMRLRSCAPGSCAFTELKYPFSNPRLP